MLAQPKRWRAGALDRGLSISLVAGRFHWSRKPGSLLAPTRLDLPAEVSRFSAASLPFPAFSLPFLAFSLPFLAFPCASLLHCYYAFPCVSTACPCGFAAFFCASSAFPRVFTAYYFVFAASHTFTAVPCFFSAFPCTKETTIPAHSTPHVRLFCAATNRESRVQAGIYIPGRRCAPSSEMIVPVRSACTPSLQSGSDRAHPRSQPSTCAVKALHWGTESGTGLGVCARGFFCSRFVVQVVYDNRQVCLLQRLLRHWRDDQPCLIHPFPCRSCACTVFLLPGLVYTSITPPGVHPGVMQTSEASRESESSDLRALTSRLLWQGESRH